MTDANSQCVAALTAGDPNKPPVLEYLSPSTVTYMRGATTAARIVAALAAVPFSMLGAGMFQASLDDPDRIAMLPAMLVTFAGDGLLILIAAGVVGRHTRKV